MKKNIICMQCLVTVVAALITGVVLVSTSCTKEQRQTAKTVIELTKDACVLIPMVTDDGTTKDVCATVDELEPYSKLIAAKRMAKDAGTEASDGDVLSGGEDAPVGSVARP